MSPLRGTTVADVAPAQGRRRARRRLDAVDRPAHHRRRGRRHPRRPPPRPGQGRVPGEDRQQALVPAVLRPGRRRGAARLPDHQRDGRRRHHRLPGHREHQHRGRHRARPAHARSSATPATSTSPSFAGADRRPRRPHARQQAEARRARRRHVHADQHRFARRAVRHPRRVPAAVGDPRHGHRREEARSSSSRTASDAIAIRSMVYLALSYDHRIVDGADAARFLTAVKDAPRGGRLRRASSASSRTPRASATRPRPSP